MALEDLPAKNSLVVVLLGGGGGGVAVRISSLIMQTAADCMITGRAPEKRRV